MANRLPTEQEFKNQLNTIKLPTEQEFKAGLNRLPNEQEFKTGLNIIRNQQLQSRLEQTAPSNTPDMEINKPPTLRMAEQILSLQASPMYMKKGLGDMLASPAGQLGIKALEFAGVMERVIAVSLQALFNKESMPVTPKEALHNAIVGDPKHWGGDINMFKGVQAMTYGMDVKGGRGGDYRKVDSLMKDILKDHAIAKFIYNTLSAGAEVPISFLSFGLIGKGIKSAHPMSEVNQSMAKTAEEAYLRVRIDDRMKEAGIKEAEKWADLNTQVVDIKATRDTIKQGEITSKVISANIKDLRGAIQVTPTDIGLQDKLKQTGKSLRDINKAIKYSKVEYTDKAIELTKKVDITLSSIYDEIKIKERIMNDIINSPTLKGTKGIETKIFDEGMKRFKDIANARQTPSEVLQQLKVPINTMRNVDTRVIAIDDGLKLLNNMRSQINAQVKRSLLINDIANMVKPATKDVTLPFKTLNKGFVDNIISSYGVKNIEDLYLVDLESLYDRLKMGINLPEGLKLVWQASNVFHAEWLTFKKMGVSVLHSDVDDALRTLFDKKREFAAGEKQLLSGWKDVFRRPFGEDDGKMLSYITDTGSPYSAPKDLLSKYNNRQIRQLMDMGEWWRKQADEPAEVAIAQGKMSRDAAQLNALKVMRDEQTARVKDLAQRIKKEPDANAKQFLRGELYMLNKELKNTRRLIKDHPPVYIKDYYPHKILKRNLEGEEEWAKAEYLFMGKYASMAKREIQADILNTFGSKAFNKRIPLNINAPEFKKRLKEETLFSRDFWAVAEAAHTSEWRKVLLEPALQRGGNFIFSLPDSDYKEMLSTIYSRYARLARGMQVKGDVNLNKWFYKGSKAISKIVEGKKSQKFARRFGVTPHWTSREDAWSHFTGLVRKNTIRATMWGNLRVATKGLFQVMHTHATIGTKATWAGFESMFTKDGRELAGNYNVMIGRMPLEALDITTMNVVDKVMLMPNQLIEYKNCIEAGNGAVWKIFTSNHSKMVELDKFIISKGGDPKGMFGFQFWHWVNEAVKAGHFQDVMNMANETIKYTQWSYRKHELPATLSSSTGKTLGMFTSWSQNYVTSFLPQIVDQLRTGKTTYGETLKLTDPLRYAIFGYATALGTIIYMGTQLGFDMSWMMPQGQLPTGRVAGTEILAPVSPPAANISDLLILLGKLNASSMTDKDVQIDEALRRFMGYGIYTTFPTGVAGRTWEQVRSGKKPPQSIFLPTTPDKTVKGSTRRVIRRRR